MSNKLSAAQLVQIAITWAEESMMQMICGCPKDDPYRAEVSEQLKQLRIYRRQRFGKPRDPLEGANLVDVTELRRQLRDS